MPDTITLYEDNAGEFRWTRRAPNGDVVADSGEGYQSKITAESAANREAEGTDAEVRWAEVHERSAELKLKGGGSTDEDSAA
jgi:uncharacterized protein YegP (UPF0339 family)